MSAKNLNHLLCLALVIFPLSCHEYERIQRQLSTFTELMSMSNHIQYIVEEKGFAETKEFESIIRNFDGVDRWGNPYMYRVRRDPEFSFIFVSLGADGLLDVVDADLYFEMEQVDIVGQLDRDIVTRNGTWVTKASNK